MAASPTTTVEIDSGLLAQLRQRDPRKSDREMLEDLAVIAVGDETLRALQERNADADEDEVMAEAVKAVREVRREMAGERRASG
ncbi:MAG: hypothetical protein H0X42_04980 [Solirubrobacterales bacterium]|nr:hypothetical protein [Solirubrobacterales bacterium]